MLPSLVTAQLPAHAAVDQAVAAQAAPQSRRPLLRAAVALLASALPAANNAVMRRANRPLLPSQDAAQALEAAADRLLPLLQQRRLPRASVVEIASAQQALIADANRLLYKSRSLVIRRLQSIKYTLLYLDHM